MIERQKKFLTAILGVDGASALEKVASRSEAINQALLPRSVFAWVNGMGEFDGFIPGTNDVVLRFTKSEKGFTGCVDLHKFEDASLIHVSASLAVALGAGESCGDEARSLDLENLGKSLDLLVKSKLAKADLTPEEVGKRGGAVSQRALAATKLANKTDEYGHHSEAVRLHKQAAHHHDSNPLLATSHKNAMSYHSNAMMAEHHYTGLSPTKKNEELVKAGMTPEVKNAAPEAPAAPTAPIAANQSPATKPVAPKPAVAKVPKLPKAAGATVALTRSEMNYLCPMCAGKQFNGDEFKGCICFQALAKSVDTLAVDELGIVIHVAEDMATITTLMESMGRL